MKLHSTMSNTIASDLTPATHERLHVTKEHIEDVLAAVLQHFSPLNGMTIDEYFENHPKKWKKRMFEDHKSVIDNGNTEKLSCKLLYMMIRYLDCLADSEDRIWTDDKNSLEWLVKFVYQEWDELNSEPAMSDHAMKGKLNTVMFTLKKIIYMIEDKKNINLADLKSKLRRDNVTISNNVLAKHSIHDKVSTKHSIHYKVSAKHSIHRFFVFLYRQLNQLNGNSIFEFRKRKKQNPLVAYTSAEQYMLEKGFPPEKMTVRLLFKLLQRVCGLKPRQSEAWTCESNSLEYLLTCINEKHHEITSKSHNIDSDWSHKLFQLFENALDAVASYKNTSKKEIIKEIPDEPVHLNEAYFCHDLPLDNSFYSEDHQTPYADTSLSVGSVGGPTIGLPSQANLSLEELRVTCLYHVLCAGGPAVKTLSIVFKEFGGDINNLISSKKKANLSLADKEKLAKGIPLAELDITLLFKLIQYGCSKLADSSDPSWYSDGRELPNLLYKLKCLRNQFSHQKMSLSENELQQRMAEFRDLLKLILEETQTLTCTVMTEKVRDMEKEIGRLGKLPVCPDDLLTYKNKVEELREQLCNDLIYKCREELIGKYTQDSAKLASPVTWCIPDGHKALTIEKAFVEPDIDYSGSELRIESVLSLLEVPGKVIIHGVSGTGKTSICQFLSYTWACSCSKANKSIDLLISIKCKSIRHGNESLLGFLRSYLPKSLYEVDKEDIIPTMQNMKILFIIDAYDEATDEAEKLVQDILDKLPRSAVIVTTKDYLVSKLEKEIYSATSSSCMFLKILGFSKEKQKKYVQNYFKYASTNGNKSSEMLDYLEHLDTYHKEFVSLPLTLSLFAFLWDYSSNAREAKTLTRIYRKLIELTMKRYMHERRNIRKWILALGSAAWVTLKGKKHILSERDVDKLLDLGESLKLPKNAVLTALLQAYPNDSPLDIADNWSFFHNSQQEFLAAEYLAHEIQNNNISLPKETPLQVTEFIVGILDQDDELTEVRVNELLNLISFQNPLAFQVIWRLAHENHYIFSRISSLFQNQCLNEQLSHFDPECTRWIIENTAIDIPETLELKNSACYIHKMTDLLYTLNQRSCRPEIKAKVDALEDIDCIIQLLQSKYHLNFDLKLLIENCVHLQNLIKCWKWNRPLHILFPKDLFSLLWWELLLSLSRNIDSYQIVCCSDILCLEDYESSLKQMGHVLMTNTKLNINEIMITLLYDGKYK